MWLCSKAKAGAKHAGISALCAEINIKKIDFKELAVIACFILSSQHPSI